ncbi:MAG: YebC/PmpR family DNA-binding transcriptional regulator [Planctomycetota bacterium]
MAGHSKWANIKHRKGRQDAKRSKLWSKCSRAIIAAAKAGGPDPAANLTLRYAIDEAKSQNMPKDTIEKAIAKGAGGGDGDDYEEIVYEGYGPAGVAVLLEILTDNRNRTAPEIRKIFEKAGGSLGASNSVAFQFERKGEIYLEANAATEDQLMELALEAGAEDIESSDQGHRVIAEPTDFLAVREALENAGLPLASAKIAMIPTTPTAVSGGGDAEKLLRFLDDLEDHDDVQAVHHNADIPEEELERLGA